MAITIMSSGDVASDAEMLLQQRGVQFIIPVLWEVVMFEASLAPQMGRAWNSSDIVKRYVELERDHLAHNREGVD